MTKWHVMSGLNVLLLLTIILLLVSNIYILRRHATDNCQSTDCLRQLTVNNCSDGKIPHPTSSLTMFTSFPFAKSKINVNLNTLQNWKHINHSPIVILFTNDPRVALAGRESEWLVQNITEEPLPKVPALRALFLESMGLYNSFFNMYANADILFDAYLVEILTTIEQFLEKEQIQNLPVLIVGQRTNIDVSREPGTWKQVLRKSYIAYTRFQKDAVDYFITNRAFPWSEVPPLVIGRVGFDNWIIAYARFRHFVTIDASASIPAIHQTTTGNFEGFTSENWDFNRELIEDTKPPFDYGLWGRTDCCAYKAFYDDCGHVQVTKRQYLPSYCGRLYVLDFLKSLAGEKITYMGKLIGT